MTASGEWVHGRGRRHSKSEEEGDHGDPWPEVLEGTPKIREPHSTADHNKGTGTREY